MDENRKTILVLGGTGHYGRNVVSGLLKKGARVRVLTRDPEKGRKLLGDRVEFIAGDIASRENLNAAIHGVDGMVVAISAFSPKLIRRLKEIEHDGVISAFEAARKNGVKRVVYISVFEIRSDLTSRLNLAGTYLKYAVEQYLTASDLDWTIFGAPPSMEIFFAMIRGNTMMVPGGGPPAGLPTISPVDVGEIVSQAVLRSDLKGRRIKMVGPQALRFPDAAQRIGSVWGKSIGFRKIPLFFPRLAYYLTWPLAPFSDRIFFVRTMLGYVRLLNQFPREIAEMVPELHSELRETFSYTPLTIELEAARRKTESP